MRLFKRQSTDMDPQLVSATTIKAQDGVVENFANNTEENVNSIKMIQLRNNDEDIPTGNRNSAILTFGRRFGRRWDRLTRSESSDFLSTSGRKKRWNLQQQKSWNDSLGMGKSSGSDMTAISESGIKCTKSTKSIMHYFRSSDKSGIQNIAINDIVNQAEHDFHQPIEKFHSDSALKTYRYYPELSEAKRVIQLKEQKKKITNLISNLEEKGKTLDFIIDNPDLLKTEQGVKLAQENLKETTFFSEKRELNPSYSRANRQQFRPMEWTGLENVLNNLRVCCDESGYDTDSTRTGAESPDGEQLKNRIFSITSDDYQGVNLSLNNIQEKDNDPTNPLDDTITINDTLKFEQEAVTPIKLTQVPKFYTPSFHKSTINLMENELSPCKDSPPIKKININFQCLSGKRSRSKMESQNSIEQLNLSRHKIQKTLTNEDIDNVSTIVVPRPIPLGTPKKILLSRELKSVKIIVPKQGGLGLTLNKCGTARPVFVVTKIEDDGEAAKSQQFRIGDEIRRIQHRRLQGLNLIEVNNELERCLGAVELQIAREPVLNADQRISNTWGDTIVRSKSDRVSSVQNKNSVEKKFTGMSKFFVKNKESEENSRIFCRKKAVSLCVDLLTIILKNTDNKKLGFSIVGGLDAKRGAMGIIVKEIKSDGVAGEQGNLQVKDEILAVNGISLIRKTHSEALHIIKTAKGGNMVLHVARKDRFHQRFAHLDV